LSRDYPGLKAEPEYGLALTPAALQRLQTFRFKGWLREVPEPERLSKAV
jgi:hypothetical protein